MAIVVKNKNIYLIHNILLCYGIIQNYLQQTSLAYVWPYYET